MSSKLADSVNRVFQLSVFSEPAAVASLSAISGAQPIGHPMFAHLEAPFVRPATVSVADDMAAETDERRAIATPLPV